ncbi:lipopolysaccharide biosynthesis protein [Singulisphaera rosea]
MTGMFAVLDQGLFAIGNFTLTTALARETSSEVFGAYSIAFAWFLLVMVVHSSLVTEPLVVFGPRGGGLTYYRAVARLHWGVTAGVSAVLLTWAVLPSVWSDSIARTAWLSVIGYGVGFLYMYYVRRKCCARFRMDIAVAGGLAYLLSSLLLLVSLIKTGGLTLPAVLGGQAVAALIIAWGMDRILDRTLMDEDAKFDFRGVARDHCHYGRSAVMYGLLSVLSTQIYLLALETKAAASFRASMNVAMPLLQSYSALGAILVARMSREYSVEGRRPPRSLVCCAVGLVGLAVVLALPGIFGARTILSILYRGRYDDCHAAAALFVVQTIPMALGVVLASASRATNNPSHVVYANMVCCALSVIPGIPLAYQYGTLGAVAGLLIATVVAAVFHAILWISIARRDGCSRA